MVRRASTAALLGAITLLSAPAAQAKSPGHVFRRAGIAVRVPAGWFVSTEPLNGVTDPVERFVLSSYRIPVGADAGDGYVPPARAVLAQLVEEVPPLVSRASAWPKRPSRFAVPRLGRMETFTGRRWGELLFRDHRRHFYVFVWIGRRASSSRVATLLRALDRMRIVRS
jgi:hypothetical protein